MNNNLTQLVYEYSINNKCADKDFIEKVLSNLLVDKLNVIEPIVLDESPILLDRYATKYYYSNEIYVYVNNMENMLSTEANYWKQIIYSYNKNMENINTTLVFQYNLSVVRIILFQLEHIKKYLNYNSSNNLEDVLFDLGSKIKVRYAYLKNRVCSKDHVIDINSFSKEFIDNQDKLLTRYRLVNHDYRQSIKIQGLNGIEPSNRISNIKSVEGIDLIINELDIEDSIKDNLILLNNYYRMHYMFTNYYSNDKLLLNPLKRYTNFLMLMREYSTEKYNSEELDKIIKRGNHLPIKQKIYYGLGLSSEEYDDVCRGKVKII